MLWTGNETNTDRLRTGNETNTDRLRTGNETNTDRLRTGNTDRLSLYTNAIDKAMCFRIDQRLLTYMISQPLLRHRWKLF